MGRKKKVPEHENLERWLVSYADFITLLFAFFTTLYAISTVDGQKMGRLVLSMQAAFDPTGFSSTSSSRINIISAMSSSSSSPGSAKDKNSLFNRSVYMRQRLEERKKLLAQLTQKKQKGEALLGKIKDEISRLIVDDTLSDKVHIIIRARGVVISLAEAGFFSSGSHTVKKESLPLLDKISRYLALLPNLIRVEGHTDNQKIRTRRFPSNWELSTARATSIVSYLINVQHFDPIKLSAAGYAEFHPVSPNDTPEGRARNRRVDIIIHNFDSQTAGDVDGI